MVLGMGKTKDSLHLRTTKIEQPWRAAHACKIGLECNNDPARKGYLYKNGAKKSNMTTSTTRLTRLHVYRRRQPTLPRAPTRSQHGSLPVRGLYLLRVSAYIAPSDTQIPAVHESEVKQGCSMPHALVQMVSSQTQLDQV